MGDQVLPWAAALSAVVAAVALAMVLWRLRRAIGTIERRLDESLRQVEMTAEEVRKTSAAAREILEHARRSAANVEHVTEGVRALRKVLDAATAVLDHAVVPVLGTVAGGLAGAKAALSHVFGRFLGKGERP